LGSVDACLPTSGKPLAACWIVRGDRIHRKSLSMDGGRAVALRERCRRHLYGRDAESVEILVKNSLIRVVVHAPRWMDVVCEGRR